MNSYKRVKEHILKLAKSIVTHPIDKHTIRSWDSQRALPSFVADQVGEKYEKAIERAFKRIEEEFDWFISEIERIEKEAKNQNTL